MAHFAQLDGNNIVTQVIVVSNSELMVSGVESEAKGVTFCESLLGGRWVQTSYNGSIRKQFAGIGYRYDQLADVFISPSPFPSWTLNDGHDWQPPTPKPEGPHEWDEDALAWKPIQIA
jgi:hypothetical protein